MESLKHKLIKLYEPQGPLPEQRKRFQKFAKENVSIGLLKVADALSKSERKREQQVAAHILIPDVYFLDPQVGQKIIFRLANSNDWEVREEAATILKGLNKKHFKEMVPVYKKWIKDGGNFIQRAISVGLFGVKDNFDLACKVIEPVLKNPNRYVRINLGPFSLARLYYKDKETVQKYIKRWLKSDNENVLWNVVMIFSQARGNYEPDAALEMIKEVGKRSESNLVQRGCASVLYNVAKHHPQKAQAFVDQNRNRKWFAEIFRRARANLARKGIT